MFTESFLLKIIVQLMKVFILIFSLFFLISAANDCCLDEFEESIVEIQSGEHSEHQSSESPECDDCLCSIFCSYNLLLVSDRPELIPPSIDLNLVFFPPNPIATTPRPFDIFHPPIV